MPRILLTAFDAYEGWSTNASRLCLDAVLPMIPTAADFETQIYPVDFAGTRERIEADLRREYDFALHLGQAPGSAAVRLEMFAVNAGGLPSQTTDQYAELEPGGPAAYRTALPLSAWITAIRNAGTAAEISFHAGTYLCNALLYWSHFFSQQAGQATQAAFMHLPLTPEQCLAGRGGKSSHASLPVTQTARAVHVVLEQLLLTDVRPADV